MAIGTRKIDRFRWFCVDSTTKNGFIAVRPARHIDPELGPVTVMNRLDRCRAKAMRLKICLENTDHARGFRRRRTGLQYEPGQTNAGWSIAGTDECSPASIPPWHKN